MSLDKPSLETLRNVKTRNLDYLGMFMLLFGFILSIVGFWQSQTILWNRIKYTTGNGSQWQNANPIYMLTPIEELRANLNKNLFFFIFGNVLLIVCGIILIIQHIKGKKWYNTSKMYTILLAIASGLMFIFSFWHFNTIRIIGDDLQDGIADFPTLGGTISGPSWIRGQIEDISYLYENFSRVFRFTTLIVLLSTFIILFINRKNYRTSVKSQRSTFTEILKGIIKSIPLYVILIGYITFTIFPIFLAIRASVSNPYEINQGNWPKDALKSLIINYSSVMFAISVEEPSFIVSLKNSVIIGLGTSTIGLAVSVTSAYALARFKFKAKTFLTFLILSTQMFPGIILLIPQFVILSDLGFIENTRLVLLGLLIVMATGSTAYVTWMMKGYFETIPIDMEEAALIDGYGRFQSFFKIALPLAKSGIVAVMVFTFLGAWQEFVLARTFIQSNLHINGTLPLLFFNYQDLNQPNQPTFFELLSPYSILVAVPVVIFYMLLQKQLVGGATAGGIK